MIRLFPIRMVLLTLVVLGAVDAAPADMILLRGTAIPLRDCEIQDVRDGRVYFRDGRGRRQFRERDELDALGFDAVPDLEAAEDALRKDEHTRGQRLLIRAAAHATDELHRVWIHARLAEVHATDESFTPGRRQRRARHGVATRRCLVGPTRAPRDTDGRCAKRSRVARSDGRPPRSPGRHPGRNS